LLHELLHYALQEDDADIYNNYQIKGIYGDSPSSAFEAWLANDCKNPGKN